MTDTKALRDVIAEREKQRAKWGDSHDDDHHGGTLSVIAAGLAVYGTDASVRDPEERVSADAADCGMDAWRLIERHPARRDQLVIAAALLLAEIERLDRAGGVAHDPPPDLPPRRLRPPLRRRLAPRVGRPRPRAAAGAVRHAADGALHAPHGARARPGGVGRSAAVTPAVKGEIRDFTRA